MGRHRLKPGSMSGAGGAEAFLRSIHIRLDADAPERIGHFIPTTKSLALIESLIGDKAERAYVIVAPYGSGKSLTATYLLQLIENRPDASGVLKRIEPRLGLVSPTLQEFAAARRRSSARQGLVIALHGSVPSLPEALQSAALDSMERLKLGREARPLREMACADMDDAVRFLNALLEKIRPAGLDRLAILWDEFGKHLETLVFEGRSSALVDVQTLAEFAARVASPPVTFGLLLHQGLLHYAGKLSQTARNEWTKVEGRFKTIQYVDDSKEIYRLIAEVIASKTGAKEIPPTSNRRRVVRETRAAGLFTDFSPAELEDLLAQAYPMEPTTLHLLPRISARVAQNERTLFTFLNSVALDAPVPPAALYDYFSPQMRTDVSVGGTHRQWLETESALSKVSEPEAAATLKTACLLGLGLSGERSRAGRSLLELALRGYRDGKSVSATIDSLIAKKLLLHRKHSDEVAIWHGADADLRGRLEEEKSRLRESFDLRAFLSQEAPPPAWRPHEYNDDYGVRRFLHGEYHTPESLAAYLHGLQMIMDFPPDSDGRVLYLIPGSAESYPKAEQLAKGVVDHDRLVVALPRESLPLFEAALEVWSILQMQKDLSLVSEDPFVLPELQQMADDARRHLQRLLDRVIRPAPDGARWFYRKREIRAGSPRDLRRALSLVMREVYPKTPKIWNENIVRKKPSAILVNSRKKLLLGILDRSGKENLGLAGNTPDVSMLRTVLLHTGLYRADAAGRWTYAHPRSIKDPGLHEVWELIRLFMTEPNPQGKPVAPFFEILKSPPYGVRQGLLPILFAAGLKAFPTSISLQREGVYIRDILPSEIEQLCREPDLYRLVVLNLDDVQQKYLRAIHKIFSPVSNYEVNETDLVRQCVDAIQGWAAQLPQAAQTALQLTDPVLRFRDAILRDREPVQKLFQDLPAATGLNLSSWREVVNRLDSCKAELEAVTGAYRDRALASTRNLLAFGRTDQDLNARETGNRWAQCFSENFIESLQDGIAKGLLVRLRTSYATDELLLESLASLLVGRPPSRWDDATVTEYERVLHDVVRRVEERALAAAPAEVGRGTATDGLARLVAGKMQELKERLVAMVGPEAAAKVLRSVLSVDQIETGV